MGLLGKIYIAFLFLTGFFSILFSQSVSLDDVFPINQGLLAFHSYSSYESNDGQLFIYDFKLDTLMNISKNWPLHHTINPHFSPDGKNIVFMALPEGMNSYKDWDIFLWEVGSAKKPENLTPYNAIPDEDPKFMPDGQQIVFKQNGDIKILNLISRKITPVTSDGFFTEESMPYPSVDGQKILYSRMEKIYIINVDGSNDSLLSQANEENCYYPIVRDTQTYFYTRWAGGFNHYDDIYIGNLVNGQITRCLFNKLYYDDADPYPVQNTPYVFFSSNRPEGKGKWDIYLGNLNTGKVWSLNQFSLNTEKSELGATFYSSMQTLILNKNENSAVESEFLFKTIYPNPFNEVTHISFLLNNPAFVTLKILTIDGRTAKTLIASTLLNSGSHTYKFFSENFSSGIYFCQLMVGRHSRLRKIILLK